MKILILLFLLIFGSATQAFAVGTIDIVTYYDTPDGDFVNLTVTGIVADDVLLGDNPNNLANVNVVMGTGGGGTSFGAPVTTRPLTVTAKDANFPAIFAEPGGFGISIDAVAGAPAYGEIEGGQIGGAGAPIYLNFGGGNVGVGATAAPAAYQLHIFAANSNLGITNSAGETGEVQVVWVQDGYYATYAP